MVALSADLVAAYVANNSLHAAELPKLIAAVHTALRALGAPAVSENEVKLTPAVPVRKSVTLDFIICLEDGKKFKSLKRHLQTQFGLTPVEYRQKWNLPTDYPMVAPNYAASRSALAKASGLGQLRAANVAPLPAPEEKPKRATRSGKVAASEPLTESATTPVKVRRAPRIAKTTETPAEAATKPKRTSRGQAAS